MKMSFESEIGAQAPIGYWDPLGLLTKDPSQVSARGCVEVFWQRDKPGGFPSLRIGRHRLECRVPAVFHVRTVPYFGM